VVTLTVTEKAYLLDPASGRLLPDDALLADLCADRPPATVPGLLVRGLLARARADGGPVALVSCDNLPANGRRLSGLVRGALDLAVEHRTAPAAATAWVHDNVRFPGTTIDRIVPASTPQTLSMAAEALGVRDLAAVAAEPYRQWVIEDDFPGGRPAWEKAGAILTDDATPWEQLKLRALNGVHSALAYLGAIAGCETIADALALPNLATVLRRLLADDIAPSLTPPPGQSVIHYGDSVLERFANPAICHRTLQVAMDGTQKLPQRVLHGMQARRAAGATPRWSALVVAAWMRFAMGRGDDGRSLPLDDPLADAVRAVIGGTDGSPAAVVDALLGLDAVFPDDLAHDPVVRAEIAGWLTRLARDGVRVTIMTADGAS
jgi:fructuronate reductase